MSNSLLRFSTGASTVVTLFLLIGATGCQDSGLSRAAIEGEVTIGGTPLKAGRILFTPLAPNEGPAATAVILDGRYRLERTDGPIVGQNRVVLQAEPDLGIPLDDEQAYARQVAGRPLPASPIPPQFGSNSELTVEVKADEENEFDVEIPAAAHSAARPAY